jgi:hypothetical protein
MENLKNKKSQQKSNNRKRRASAENEFDRLMLKTWENKVEKLWES